MTAQYVIQPSWMYEIGGPNGYGLVCVAGGFGRAGSKVLAAKPREAWGGSGSVFFRSLWRLRREQNRQLRRLGMVYLDNSSLKSVMFYSEIRHEFLPFWFERKEIISFGEKIKTAAFRNVRHFWCEIGLLFGSDHL